MNVNSEEFAVQVNYLAAIGRLIVPRAFKFAGHKMLFVGQGPFNPEDLALLLPEGAEWHEYGVGEYDFLPNVVVLGREGFQKGEIRAALDSARESPKVIPQEGLVDELLFGHDWWEEKVTDLQASANTHRGLQSARSQGFLRSVGLDKPQQQENIPAVASGVGTTKNARKKALRRNEPLIFSPYGTLPTEAKENRRVTTTFSWPTTEASETRGERDSEHDLRDRSKLKELGYDTNQSPATRWHILTTMAIPELGLPKVANLIAWFCRFRKQQRGGRQKYARAIAEWEHDLTRLKREVYPHYKSQFNWPRSEP